MLLVTQRWRGVRFRLSIMLLSPRFQNNVALSVVFLLYGAGIGLCCSENWALNLLGIVGLTEALLLSATLTHELIHGNLFKTHRSLNVFWGQVMTHLNGACYVPWPALVEHHFNHHLYHVDFVGFDVAAYFKALPPWVRRCYMALEWLYFPLLEFELRWRLILLPFLTAGKMAWKVRTALLMLIRTIAFGLLAWICLKALVLYGVAYISFVNLMRFADAFHHTYDYAIVQQPIPSRDRQYEQANTFSNLISTQVPSLNLLLLNFGYHNAHHHAMSCPWHDLPQLHATLYGQPAPNVLPLTTLVRNYHHFRLQRLCSGQGESHPDVEGSALDSFTGGIAVSFLTPPSASVLSVYS